MQANQNANNQNFVRYYMPPTGDPTKTTKKLTTKELISIDAVGRFQKNVFYSKVMEAILGDAVRTITKADPAWRTIVTICSSINKIPSKQAYFLRINHKKKTKSVLIIDERCLINGICDYGFDFCSENVLPTTTKRFLFIE